MLRKGIGISFGNLDDFPLLQIGGFGVILGWVFFLWYWKMKKTGRELYEEQQRCEQELLTSTQRLNQTILLREQMEQQLAEEMGQEVSFAGENNVEVELSEQGKQMQYRESVLRKKQTIELRKKRVEEQKKELQKDWTELLEEEMIGKSKMRQYGIITLVSFVAMFLFMGMAMFSEYFGTIWQIPFFASFFLIFAPNLFLWFCKKVETSLDYAPWLYQVMAGGDNSQSLLVKKRELQERMEEQEVELLKFQKEIKRLQAEIGTWSC